MGNTNQAIKNLSEDKVISTRQNRHRGKFIGIVVLTNGKKLQKNFNDKKKAEEWIKYIRSQIEKGNEDMVKRMANSHT